MLTTIPSQYTSPKWQAPITDPSKQFVTNDGQVLTNMWQVKEFLSDCNMDVFEHHINEKQHHLADWIESVIGDVVLAQELRDNTSRWGNLVTIERHLMRTVSMPSHIARRILRRSHTSFVFHSGEEVRSLQELQVTLTIIDDDTFEYHNQKVPSDLSLWVNDIIGDPEFAAIIDDSSNRKHALQLTTDYIAKLRAIIQ